MKDKKMYLVGYTTGSYDDYWFHTCFVTEDEKTAIKWVQKFDYVVRKQKDALKPYYDDSGYLDEKHWENRIVTKHFHMISDINEASYREIKVK